MLNMLVQQNFLILQIEQRLFASASSATWFATSPLNKKSLPNEKQKLQASNVFWMKLFHRNSRSVLLWSLNSMVGSRRRKREIYSQEARSKKKQH